LDKLLGWTVPLLRPGGRLLALKGSSAPAELAAAGAILAALGITDAAVRTLGPSTDPATVIEARSAVLARFT
jgi:16S rRNA (guanine527-N7)-methyltransferase